ncbi:hypothetical protein MIND_01005800 [Mycena indigotica]|uniref:Sugar phosphate phosphatase n=1 Tax=Mycena indigotica TaxID=2126181 RepID=A0A8H6SAC3_9AGAR|nr:uncharacterized protein MIND_01005800 [Mycena indigotica]KAF7294687.1 hypothetical protein MIND_01005800 [Mycena indigotica]
MFNPPAPYDPTDTKGFSYQTVVHRWPVIITGVLDRLHRLSHDIIISDGPEEGESKVKVDEAKDIIAKISRLKYEMGRDHVLDPIPDDGEPFDRYNAELQRLADNSKNTWFTAPWLFAECYLYRLLRSYFLQTTQWSQFDPFSFQKQETFQQSGRAIAQIAKSMHEVDIEHQTVEADTSKLAILFAEMIQMCLWGNATDLSLLTHLSSADIEHLQTVGKDAQDARREFILRDDQAKVWQHISGVLNGQVDFVLDNELSNSLQLYTDLVFADFLVTHTPYVSRVVFHPKLIPWFVSDVTPSDFASTLTSLLDPTFLSLSEEDQGYVNIMVNRWKGYIDTNVFSLSVPHSTPLGGGSDSNTTELAGFWTEAAPYWEMETLAPRLWQTLKTSNLVIFKGDLNYRKLTGDVQWEAWTDFSVALGNLSGSFPILSLRTNKADVVVGVPREVAEKLDASGSKWRVDGRYALISFLPAA